MFTNFITFFHNLERPYKVITGIVATNVVVILFVAVVAIIFAVNEPPNHVNITNFREVAKDVPSYYQDATEKGITNVLVNYNKVPEDLYADATIREDTYSSIHRTNSSNQEEYTISFIVDIESLQQSYLAKFFYINGESRPSDFSVDITCPNYTKVIYKNTKCTTSNNPSGEVNKYLDYVNSLPQSGATVRITKRTYDSYRSKYGGEPYLAVSVNSCDNPTITAEGQSFIESWLRERYLDPVDYHIEILNICE